MDLLHSAGLDALVSPASPEACHAVVNLADTSKFVMRASTSSLIMRFKLHLLCSSSQVVLTCLLQSFLQLTPGPCSTCHNHGWVYSNISLWPGVVIACILSSQVSLSFMHKDLEEICRSSVGSIFWASRSFCHWRPWAALHVSSFQPGAFSLLRLRSWLTSHCFTSVTWPHDTAFSNNKSDILSSW